MELWLFFTIFGMVIFLPSGGLFLLLQRFKNTIVVLLEMNGTLKKVIITNKILEKGEISEIDGKKVVPIPIKINEKEILYGKWRRWIIKRDINIKIDKDVTVTNKEIEGYLNNEDLLKLYLAGKFKDTLIILLSITIFCIIVSGIINGYFTTSKECISFNNQSTNFIHDITKRTLYEVLYNGTA